MTDFSQKQTFLNTVYENFFQGFSVKVADTHGIVYTPQAIVDFMVQSVDDLLQQEFGLALHQPGVHILDPFVGTGNFILRIMRHIGQRHKTSLRHKYLHELHCNEVMLLPYYIASMSIEHDYFELTGDYQPFSGICLVDTFELAEAVQPSFFVKENTQRVKAQQETPIFVVIGNPPYNVGQVNENDNNQNRSYPQMDKRVSETYAADSNATNKNALSDPYVKAFRWAADRLKKHSDEGIVAFVTNNSFLDGIAFDGMRKRLAEDFDALYLLDLGGNVRKNPKISGTSHNVFGIQVGVSIALLIRHKQEEESPRRGDIYYYRTGEFWRRERKYQFLDERESYHQVEWEKVEPNKRHTWLTEGLQADYEDFLPLGTKAAKAGEADAIFNLYSNGVKTNRDTWAYNFQADALSENIQGMIEVYNEHVDRYRRLGTKPQINDFVVYDDTKISWSRDLKLDVKRGNLAKFNEDKVRQAVYRPFTKQYLFFDKILNEEIYQVTSIFPSKEAENRVICLTAVGNTKPFHCLMTDTIADLHLTGDSQCFPFYTYDEDGGNQRENISDWALAQFQRAYDDDTISKWDIFYYIYGLLHHPDYAATYQANLRRQLPRIPFVEDFASFAEAGRQLAEWHINYESQPEYPLAMIETPDEQLDWRVETMRFAKNKTQLKYNQFLTLGNIPPQVFEYRLGIRSALEWLVDRYRVTKDKRSGLINDPNRLDDPEYIVRLIKQVTTVSLNTVELVASLPPLNIKTVN
jgi:predicted helicase